MSDRTSNSSTPSRGVVRLKVNSLASKSTSFGSKSVDLTKIKGVTRGNVIKSRLAR